MRDQQSYFPQQFMGVRRSWIAIPEMNYYLKNMINEKNSLEITGTFTSKYRRRFASVINGVRFWLCHLAMWL